MTTIAEARQAILARLVGDAPRRLTDTNGVTTTTDTSVTLTTALTAAQPGALLELGQELLYITGGTAPTYDVLRGMYGTTPVQHDDATLAEVNPRFRAAEITGVITEELRSWPIQLGRVETVETTVLAGEWEAELDPTTTGELHRLLSADVLPETTSTNWKNQRNRIDVRLIFDRDADEYTTGWAIQLPHRFDTDRVIQTTLLTDYNLASIASDATDLEVDVGLRDSRLDVLYYGVMWRLMSWKEIGRTDRAASPALDNEEVPPTHQLQVAQQLKQLRDQRLSEEITRMYDLYPVLMSTQ
jgi:hypothetical protein